MKSITAFVTILLLIAKATPSFSLEKSFQYAQRQCLQWLNINCTRWSDYVDANEYPRDHETLQLIRCIGLVLNFWNDYSGLQPAVIKNFFLPDGNDDGYVNRTTQCLKRVLYTVAQKDVLTLSYESFRCYFHQYGNLVVTPQYVPRTARELLQFKSECSDILRNYSKNNTRGSYCLERCVLLQADLWSDEQGPLLDRAYVQFGQDEDEDVYVQKTVECIDSYVSKDNGDSCALASYAARRCLIHGGARAYYSSVFD